jgi:hypothetical protein
MLGEDYGPRVFEKGVLKKVFGKERGGVTGDLRKVYNCDLHDLYNSPNIAKLITGAYMQPERYIKVIQNFGSNRQK